MVTRILILLFLTVLILSVLLVALRIIASREANPGPDIATFSIVIKGDSMTPPVIHLREGEQAALRIVTDHTVEFYIDGKTKHRITPTDNSTLFIKAGPPGNYAIKDAQTGKRLGTLLIEPE